jgi:hypothetical protein
MADARSELVGAVAAELGVAPLDEGEVDAVLELAGAAAHGTGDRTAAPLCCFLAGLAASAADRAETLERVRAHVTAVTADREEATS